MKYSNVTLEQSKHFIIPSTRVLRNIDRFTGITCTTITRLYRSKNMHYKPRLAEATTLQAIELIFSFQLLKIMGIPLSIVLSCSLSNLQNTHPDTHRKFQSSRQSFGFMQSSANCVSCIRTWGRGYWWMRSTCSSCRIMPIKLSPVAASK